MLPSHLLHQQQQQQQMAQQQHHHQMMMQQQMMQQQQQQMQGPPLLAQQVPQPGMPPMPPQQQQAQIGQQIPPQHIQQQQQQFEANPFHPANRLKPLLFELKQALAALLRIAADCIKVDSSNSNSDSASDAVPETNLIPLQNAFEAFLSICDQMEQCFFLLQDADRQSGYSAYFLPVNVSAAADKEDGGPSQGGPSGQGGPKTINIAQFHSTVKRQIDCARTVHDRLLEMVRELQQKQLQKET